MKVLVIGGSGYIGSHTVDELLRRKIDVFIFARGTTPSSFPAKVTLIKGDRHSHQDIAKLRSQRFDAVIDINAYTRDETQTIINALDGFISRFVHLSTLAVCKLKSAAPLVESDAMVTDPNAGYAYDKAECERALRWAHTKSGFPFVSIRPTAVIGPRDYLSRENYHLKRIINGDPIIVPDSGATPIWAVFVKDLANVLVNAISASGVEGHSYHVSQPEFITINDHIANIAHIAGTQAITAHIPSRLLERLGFNLSHFPYALPQELVLMVDSSAAQKALSYVPTPYPQALRETVEWFLQRGAETEASIEDRFPPVMPRSRERDLIDRYRMAIRELEDRLTDDWLNESMPEI
ncbi:MAG: NAD-dependent epimerase/dehydratase family protein [Acidobacteria bacterium]|nr:NAD-dependent epimerase/dehydratase family protein [Acidobacteriota bacterium]